MKNIIKNAVLLAMFLSISFSITYWAVAKYDVYSDLRATGDSQHYIRMSQGNYDVPARYAKRFFMPGIVYLISKAAQMEEFLSRYYENVGTKMPQFYFGIVNMICLSLTGFVFFHYCRKLDFTDTESFIGSLLFFTSFFVVTYYTIPLVDSMAVFFVVISLYAILTGRLLLLFSAFTLGIFTKETTLVVLLFILLDERKLILRKMLVCVPAIAAYFAVGALFSQYAQEGENILDILTNLSLLKQSVQIGIAELDLYTVIETVQIFMFLWILFVYALVKCQLPAFLKKQLWVICLPFVIPFFVRSASVGRVSFYIFPVVIPVALLGLRRLLWDNQK